MPGTIPEKYAGICKHTHTYVHICNLLDCLYLWQQLGIAELVRRGKMPVQENRHADPQSSKQRTHRPLTLHGRISNACFLFLTLELNFEN